MELPGNQRRKFISNNIYRVLSSDGRTGRLRQLIESVNPATLLTHWQSLDRRGAEVGLKGPQAFSERIQKQWGNSLERVACSECLRPQAFFHEDSSLTGLQDRNGQPATGIAKNGWRLRR